MKKIITFVLSAMAISMSLSAQETSLRDQLVGMYGGSCVGYSSYADPTAGGTYYSNTYNSDIPAVKVFPGETSDQVTISGLFPAVDGVTLYDIDCTVTETDAYADYDIVGYLTVVDDVVGSFTKSDVEYDLDLIEMDYSWNLNKDPYTFWVYSDGSIETNCYADLHYMQDFNGTEYDMYLDVRYAKISRVGDLPEATLRNSLLGVYGGQAIGYSCYSNPSGNSSYYNENYNTDAIPAVMVMPGENIDEVVISGLFPENDNVTLNNIHCSVNVTDEYADYDIVGYLVVDDETIGSFTNEDVTYDLDLIEMDYSWGLDKTPYKFWIYSDGAIETNCYADLHYMKDFSGTEYDMYLDVRYAKLNRVGDLPYSDDDVELAASLVGLYGGQAIGYSCYSNPSGNSAYYNVNYNSDDLPAVEISEGSAANQIVMAKLFPEVEGVTINDIHCSVYASDEYADYDIVGYLVVDDETIGSFTNDGITYELDLIEMDYSWGLDKTPYKFWIYSDGAIETNCYADLHYMKDFSGTEYDMYLDVRYAKLTPVEGGVQGIAADVTATNNAPVELFTINGMRVNSRNLAPGLYIRRQGNEVTKVIIK
jgi:hypothetical protein